MNVEIREEFMAINIKMWVIEVLVQDCDIRGPKLTSSHRHTKPIPINKEIPSERNPAE